MNVDFGRTAADYGRYRAGFPHELFHRLFAAGAVCTNDRVFDLGTGTGTFGRGFALRGCRVVGLFAQGAASTALCNGVPQGLDNLG